MKMRLGCRVAALTTMDEDALAGPEIVEQPRAVLHVIARAKQIADEKEYSGGSLGHFDPRTHGYAGFYFLLALRYLSKFYASNNALHSYLVCGILESQS